jgi:hypothetical protein
MRRLQQVKALSDYKLDCLFEGGVHKIADIKPWLQSEAFKPLKDFTIFNRVENRNYYVAWLNEEVDLTADTLWHIGVTLEESLPALAALD